MARKTSSLHKWILEQGMYASWSVAVIATLGSLYFSEVEHYPPCTYCWYQRILMYPLVLLLGIAAVRKDYRQTVYVLPLTIAGMLMAAFHYLTQKVTALHEITAACGPIPCNVQYINYFGFITIPFLSLAAFTLITVLQFLVYRAVKSAQGE